MITFLCCLATVAAGPVALTGSTQILSHLSDYDGRRVVYQGEVIQDVMRRGDHVWLNVSDGDNALGVWAAASLLPTDLRTGRYGQTGDRLRIDGVVHTACPIHGGELDLHATAVTRVARAEATPLGVPLRRGLAALAALVLALLAAGSGAAAERRRAISGAGRR